MSETGMMKDQLRDFICHMYSINKTFIVLGKDTCHVMGETVP